MHLSATVVETSKLHECFCFRIEHYNRLHDIHTLSFGNEKSLSKSGEVEEDPRYLGSPLSSSSAGDSWRQECKFLGCERYWRTG